MVVNLKAQCMKLKRFFSIDTNVRGFRRATKIKGQIF